MEYAEIVKLILFAIYCIVIVLIYEAESKKIDKNRTFNQTPGKGKYYIVTLSAAALSIGYWIYILQ